MSSLKMENIDGFDLIAKNHKDPGFCRICLAVKKRIAPLMSQLDSEILIQVFTSATGIDVPANDQLPKQICYHCKKILLKLHMFRKKCVHSDSVLKTVILEKVKDEHVDSGCTSEVKYQDDDFEAYDDMMPVDEKNDTGIPKLEPKLHAISSSTNMPAQGEPTTTITKDILTNDKSSDVFEENLLVIPLKEVTEDNQYMQERKLHSCTDCEQSFRSAKSLRIHIKVAHSVASSFLCRQCEESFHCEKDLRLHSSLHDDGPPWNCVECDKQFLEKQKFRRHTLRHMESKQHKCDQCDKTFSEHYALVRHLRSHSTVPQPRNYACHLCDKRYSTSTALKAHVQRHSGARPCVCATCGRHFPTPRLLTSHARTHTDTKPYACTLCEATFRHLSTLRSHTRTHTGERPYVCACCGRRFLQNSNLTQHMRTHTGEKPYKCSMCARQFSSRSSLTMHERRHTGHKPRVCNICGKGFVGADMLVHMRRHTHTHTHACPSCPRRFYTPSALRDHKHTHTGIKPFECALCQKKVTTKSHLIKHLKTHETKKVQQNKQEVNNKTTDVIPYSESEAQNIVQNPDTFILTIDIERPLHITENRTDIPAENSFNTNDDEPLNLVDVSQDHVILEVNEPLSLVDASQDRVILNSEVNEPVNLVEVSQDHVSLGTAVNSDGFSVLKLYHVDQSLVQVSSSGDQFSISKITNTLTANFE